MFTFLRAANAATRRGGGERLEGTIYLSDSVSVSDIYSGSNSDSDISSDASS